MFGGGESSLDRSLSLERQGCLSLVGSRWGVWGAFVLGVEGFLYELQFDRGMAGEPVAAMYFSSEFDHPCALLPLEVMQEASTGGRKAFRGLFQLVHVCVTPTAPLYACVITLLFFERSVVMANADTDWPILRWEFDSDRYEMRFGYLDGASSCAVFVPDREEPVALPSRENIVSCAVFKNGCEEPVMLPREVLQGRSISPTCFPVFKTLLR